MWKTSIKPRPASCGQGNARAANRGGQGNTRAANSGGQRKAVVVQARLFQAIHVMEGEGGGGQGSRARPVMAIKTGRRGWGGRKGREKSWTVVRRRHFIS